MVAATYFLYKPQQKTYPITTTTSISNNTQTNKTTAKTPTTVLNLTNSSGPSYGCTSTSTLTNIPNGNFSSGTYANWAVSGIGFGSHPTNLSKSNSNMSYYSTPWSNYSGNYFASSYHGYISLVPGNVTSQPFKVVQPYLNFQIISYPNNLLYIAILNNGVRTIIAHYDTFSISQTSESRFYNASIPMLTSLCKNVSIEIHSGVLGSISTPNNFIAAGDFYLSKTPMKNAIQPINETIR